MLVVNVQHDLGKLVADLKLMPSEQKAAGVRALNRTMTTVRAEAARSLKGAYPGLLVGDIKKRIRLKRASGSDRAPSAVLIFSGRRIALYGKFGMRSFGRWGVSFRGLPWRLETISGDAVTPEMLARAFRQRARGGRAGVFARHTEKRESFELLVAPGVARAVAERAIGDVLVRIAHRRFSETYAQEAKFRLSKRA